MFENTFKNIDDILHKDAGCSSELDYVEQSSWVLFLKYIDDLEAARKVGAELGNKKYTPIISGKYRWSEWAVPKGKDGKVDHNSALTGDDLRNFVNNELFPFLAKFKSTATAPDTLEYKIGEIFGEIQNRLQSGYNLREVLELVDQLKFQTSADIHEMSHLYEDKIKNMGNAGRNGGEYYTPRPLIKAIIKVIAPKIGQTIYDGASGSAGFLCESFAYLSESKQLTTSDVATLQKKTFYGKEKKSLAYIIGTMNMILHGIDAPNLIHTNTLGENIADIQEKNRYDIVLANPPFGGKERAEIQQNFPIKTGETAYLFLQHFMKILRAGGSAGIVIKSTFLTNSDAKHLRKALFETCDVHTILELPKNTFAGAGVHTVVLFFKKGSPTKNIWYYRLPIERNLGKANPISDDDFVDFLSSCDSKKASENSALISVSKLNQETFEITLNNLGLGQVYVGKDTNSLVEGLRKVSEMTSLKIEELGGLLADEKLTALISESETWGRTTIGESCEYQNGKAHEQLVVSDGEFRLITSKFVSSNGLLARRVSKQLTPVESGDVVFVLSDLPKGKALAKAFLVTNETDLTLNQRVLRIRSDKFDPRFLYLQINRHPYLLSFDNGESQTHLKLGQVMDCPLLIPPLEVQVMIAEHVFKIKEAISFTEKSMSEVQSALGELHGSFMQQIFKDNRK